MGLADRDDNYLRLLDENGVRAPPASNELALAGPVSALGGIRTPNLLIRSQVLYPLSYERRRAAIDVQVAIARTTGYRVAR